MIARNQKGFSILEVLIGTTVFTVGMLAIVSLQLSSIKGGAFSGEMTEALALGANKLEELLSAPYDPADDLPNQRLTDQDGDGTNKDLAGDGQDASNNNFGLDDRDCGPADACAKKADGILLNQGRNGLYTVYWNVAFDEPYVDCKIVKVLVQWTIKDEKRVIHVSGVKAKGA